MSDKRVLGILAGGGPLPARLAQAAFEQGWSVFIVGFEGFADPTLIAPFPHKMLRLAAVKDIFSALREHGCSDVVLLGPVKRPAWRDLKPDSVGTRILMRLGRAVFLGDDGLLAGIVKILEEEGFRVRGAHEFLHQETHAKGVLGKVSVDQQALCDIARAAQVLSVISSLDIGQGCVVQNGVVLALEALEGTDVMLQRCQPLKQDGPGGVLLKMPKSGQELRADMPAIGPETVRLARQASLRGIAFVSGMTLVINQIECIAEADQLGLFLYGMTLDELNRLSEKVGKSV
ncbi:UDP-2,3-diacylglucosamine diphosphatase LpxI [Saccharibacter sp. 17.LH.SD]|uniref:LpxI family protein n=1 Tax=Saccharibacter sp. 17.LH.SD TaxID=2689393 RepID=UPI00136926DB|nr:UDP-2,3-diacylglucosamine diphosphatase LpxI [Saccharibacter sp. 17.LH.SD]MXV44101.1 UDP-2,3-diacylglucosamine diphosphatase LpxI [Saccharibacter sp. 17.LH.SD]